MQEPYILTEIIEFLKDERSRKFYSIMIDKLGISSIEEEFSELKYQIKTNKNEIENPKKYFAKMLINKLKKQHKLLFS